MPLRHPSAFTNTGLALPLPATRVAIQKGKQLVPTATSEHSSPGRRSQRGTSHMVASTLSQVPLVTQSCVGRSSIPGPNATDTASSRLTCHRTLRTVISTVSQVNARTHVLS